MKYIFGTIVRKDEEDGGYWAEIPDLPGCYGYGDTYADCVRSASDGVETHIAALIEDGRDIPKPSRLRVDDGDIVYVYADPETVELGEPSISASSAAERLGVTKGRISQLIAAGKLKAYRTPHYTMVTVASVEDYEASPRKAGRPVARPAEVMEA